MARIRSVKPEYWTSEQVMNMSRDARLLFIGLWNFCDDNGIHPASALSLKAEVLPGDTLTADQVMVFIDEMIEQGLVEEYEAHGRSFWRVTGWRRHQRIDQPTFRHPTGDTQGDAGDTSDTRDAKGDRVTSVTYKRLGGKQRQIVLRKLRERDGDACHLCGNTSNLSILSLAPNGDENASDIKSLRLICSTCKRARKRSDAKNIDSDAQGDAQILCSDSTTESSRVESNGEERKEQTNFSSLQASTIARGDTGDRDHPSQRPQRERNVQISMLLNAQGIEATAMHPTVACTWARNDRVTDVVLNTAIAKAKATLERQGRGDVSIGYLEPIVTQLLAAPQTLAYAAQPGRPEKFNPTAYVNRNRIKQ